MNNLRIVQADGVVTRNDEVFAAVVLPAQNGVRVRVVGVPVIAGYSFQPRADVGLDACYEMSAPSDVEES